MLPSGVHTRTVWSSLADASMHCVGLHATAFTAPEWPGSTSSGVAEWRCQT